MADQKEYLVRGEPFPLNPWMEIRVLNDGTHKQYSINFNKEHANANVLLFDLMHVDAAFHREEDPLHSYYPSIDNIIAELTSDRVIKPLEVATEILSQITEVFDALQNNFERYTDSSGESLPLETVRELGFFENDAEQYRIFTFENQISNLQLARRATDKQILFLSELNKSRQSEELQATISIYENLHRTLQEHITAVTEASQGYDTTAQLLYDGKQSFPKFSAQPIIYNDNVVLSNFYHRTMFLARPSVALKAHSLAQGAYKEVIGVAEQAIIKLGREGHYSNRHDLRQLLTNS